MIFSVICTLLGIIGIVGIFTENLALVVLGAAASLTENAVEIFSGKQRNLNTVILAAVCGGIYASFAHIPLWMGIAFGLCVESAIIGLFSWALLLLPFFPSR